MRKAHTPKSTAAHVSGAAKSRKRRNACGIRGRVSADALSRRKKRRRILKNGAKSDIIWNGVRNALRNARGARERHVMKKIRITGDGAYVLGQIFLAWGAALITAANFGVSMVVAPAYLISEKIPFLTFGMSEYIFQAFLLAVFCAVVGRFRVKYLLSFVTAFIYGNLLDLDLFILSLGGNYVFGVRVLLFAAGVVATAIGVAFFFNTYLPLGVYELFVKGLCDRFSLDIGKTKVAYDCSSLAVACVMSVAFFGLWPLRGIGLGTLICALLNGVVISAFSKLFTSKFDFTPLWNCPAWMK